MKDSLRRPYISVVIPSYKPDYVFKKCLESVLNQSYTDSYEVIVVDSSPYDIAEKYSSLFPDVKFIHLSKRTLPGKARSEGARIARGEIIFFTDTDCIVDKDWIKNHLKFHNKGYRVVGGGVANGTPHSIIGTAEYLLSFNEMNDRAKPCEVKAHPSCNLSVERSVFDKVGFFPDFMKGEDTIFCDNVISTGEKIYFNPEARIYHKNRVRFMQFIRNQISLGEGSNETRRRTRRHGYFLIKHPYLIPLIPLFRTFAIGRRLIASDIRLFIKYILLYPLIFLGLVVYVWGFVRGPYRSGLSTEKRR